MTILATDPFTGTGGAGLGANWTTTTSEQAPTLNSNEAAGTSAGGASGARFTGALIGGGAWPNDQYSEVVVGSVVGTTTDEGVGGACRIAAGAQTHYLAQTNTTQTRLYKVVAGVFTQLGADGPACVSGDLLRTLCNGTSISVTRNGATIIGPVTDAGIAAGSAGIWCTNPGGPGTINSFEGGDFTTPGVALEESGYYVSEPQTNQTIISSW